MLDASIATLKLTGRPAIYRCEPGWDWRPLPLVDYDVWCVLDGRGRMHLEGQELALEPGICLVLHPGARVRATQDPQQRLRVFACHFMTDDADLPTEPVQVTDMALLLALAREAEACSQHASALAREQTMAAVRLLLLHLSGVAAELRPSPVDARIARLHEAIREEPGRAWTVPMLAARANLSASQLTRRFVAEIGVPPGRCVTLARMDRARQLLRETRLSISAIAEALGYRDLYYFSRQFKQETGRSPTTWRHHH